MEECPIGQRLHHQYNGIIMYDDGFVTELYYHLTNCRSCRRDHYPRMLSLKTGGVTVEGGEPGLQTPLANVERVAATEYALNEIDQE